MTRKHAPSIIFMNKIKSVGSSRIKSSRQRTMMDMMVEFLNQLDGFEATKNIEVIVATEISHEQSAMMAMMP